MIDKINFKIESLNDMKTYPEDIYYIGNTSLLKNKKVSIVGTRKPISYTKNLTSTLSAKLSNANITVVSGAAMGVDAISHKAAINNTIAIAANGLNIRYPSVNKNLIREIEEQGLILSTYPDNEKARAYTFIQRNELVVALGDVLIITQADLKSGSMRSAQFAINMGKQIYVLPHRIEDSEGTNELLKKGQAKAIYDIDEFITQITGNENQNLQTDEFLEYCKLNTSYDNAVQKYNQKVFEYELLGKITIENGYIKVL